MRLAGHLDDYALEAASEDAAVREGVAAIYERRAARETSLMAEDLFHAAAAAARQEIIRRLTLNRTRASGTDAANHGSRRVVVASAPICRALAIPGRFCVARPSYDQRFLGTVSPAGLLGTDNFSRRREGQATPEQGSSEPAAQRSERRRREISYRRMPTGREVLEIFQDAGVHPETADDRHAASAHAVACHSNGGRPSVGDEMLELAGKPGSYHLLSRQQGQDGEENDAAPSQNPK
jgi:hypothetical protein